MIDYDALSRNYARHRKVHPYVLQELHKKGVRNSSDQVLEVGCGTGNYINALQEAGATDCWGIDPSEGMLAEASIKNTLIKFKSGRAEEPKFADSFFDFVFSVDVIHHLEDIPAYFNEVRRVLKPGGRFCTVTESEELIRTRVPLSSYFPQTVPFELQRYPRIPYLCQVLREKGFGSLSESVVRFPYEISDISPFANKTYSTLHLITEEELQAGLVQMQADLQQGPIKAVSHYLLLWAKAD